MIRDLVINSRSWRSFDESVRVSREDLLEWLDTARLCPSGVNRQPLKYRLVNDPEEVEDLLALTHWGGLLPDVKLPPDGHHPTAFAAVCFDTTVSENLDLGRYDAGIACQTILLAATEAGFGGIMIGAFNEDKVGEFLRLPKKLKPLLLLAFGKPDEAVFLCDLPADGSTKYYRDKANVHFVPKRALDDIVVE